jgi:NADH-quinone oxidoreductase subunit H
VDRRQGARDLRDRPRRHDADARRSCRASGIGPNIAGPFGLLQTLADGMKLFFKEDLLPDKADKFVFRLAPYLSLMPAFLLFGDPARPATSPTADGHGHDRGVTTRCVQVADPPIGILFVLAMPARSAVYGIMLAGWSSGSKYPLLGSVRASAQMVSYEAALGLSSLACCSTPARSRPTASCEPRTTWNWNVGHRRSCRSSSS